MQVDKFAVAEHALNSTWLSVSDDEVLSQLNPCNILHAKLEKLHVRWMPCFLFFSACLTLPAAQVT